MIDGKLVSENLVVFVPFKQLNLVEPGLEIRVAAAGNDFQVSVTAAKTALWCWLDLAETDARFSDNFIHLNAGESRQIQVSPTAGMTGNFYRSAPCAESIRHLYVEPPNLHSLNCR